jgi:hypothetical protein
MAVQGATIMLATSRNGSSLNFRRLSPTPKQIKVRNGPKSEKKMLKMKDDPAMCLKTKDRAEKWGRKKRSFVRYFRPTFA